MILSEIIKILDATVLSEEIDMNLDIRSVCGSDMMSDVLAFVKQDSLLLTGLNNLQVMRTAEMLDIVCLVFVRGKTPSDMMLDMAAEMEMPVLRTEKTMFEACGLLYQAGLRGGHKDE